MICLGGCYTLVLWSKLTCQKCSRIRSHPSPLSLAHIDGSMNKTDKAKLMHNLEAFGEAGTVPKLVDVTLVDAGCLLHTLQNVPQAFGYIS